MLLSLTLFSLSGCGDTNSQANLNPTSGKHPSGWVPTGHQAAAKTDILSCTECHGNDFTGGISKVACSECHSNVDSNTFAIHPQQWGQFAYALHGPFVVQNGTESCSNVECHGAGLTGIAGSGPSCTSCHLGGSALSPHPVGWNTAADLSSTVPLHAQFVGNNGTTSCRNLACHGANLQGVFLSGPSCNACHNFTL